MARHVVLSDASPIIALSLIDRLDLIRSLLRRITITEVVHAEVIAGGDRPGQLAIASAIKAKWIRVIADESLEPRMPHLDEGDASTLRAAIQHGPPCLVLIDERAGRLVAKEAGIAHTGTIGLMLQAKNRGLVPAIRPLFEQLLASGFRISAELIEAALDQAGEK
jgi:predicted nucleic acid-binding protein